MLLKLRQSLGSIGTKDDAIALVLEDDADHLGQGDVVVDDEDARTHSHDSVTNRSWMQKIPSAARAFLTVIRFRTLRTYGRIEIRTTQATWRY